MNTLGEKPKLQTELWVDDPALNVQFYQAESPRLVLVFRSIFTGIADLQFAMTATRRGKDAALFICDKTNSWLNGPHLIERIVGFIDRARKRVSPDQTVSIGSSMGGFMALVMSGFTKLDIALGFSPQYSVKEEIVPAEKRWKNFRQNINDYRIESAHGHLAKGTEHVGVFPRQGIDQQIHFQLYKKEEMRLYLLPTREHNIGAFLSDFFLLLPFIEDIFDGKFYRARKRNLGLKETLKSLK